MSLKNKSTGKTKAPNKKSSKEGTDISIESGSKRVISMDSIQKEVSNPKENKEPSALKEDSLKEWLVNATKVNMSTKMIFEDNPKRKGSAAWDRYDKYSAAVTWGQYLQLNIGKFCMADVKYDEVRKFVKFDVVD